MMLISAAGKALPCHAAEVLPGFSFENVREKSLEWIWQESPSFQRFRGEDWMPEPCRGCERRAEDFGGCRCQAFLLSGDAALTDPACSLAPSHSIVEAAVRDANADVAVAQATPASSFVRLQKQNAELWTYRRNPE